MEAAAAAAAAAAAGFSGCGCARPGTAGARNKPWYSGDGASTFGNIFSVVSYSPNVVVFRLQSFFCVGSVSWGLELQTARHCSF